MLKVIGRRASRLAALGTAMLVSIPSDGRGYEIPQAGLSVAITPAVVSDYIFRGVSQTRNNWAAQATFDVVHTSGLYVGAFVSNAKFLAEPYNNIRQELDLLAGYRTTLGPIEVDLGYVAYLYPGQTKPEGTELTEYQEIVLRLGTTIGAARLAVVGAFSPNNSGRSGKAYYLEGGATVTLPYEFRLLTRLGYQWVQDNERFGTPDYLWYGVGVQREVYGGITVTLAWIGTNIARQDCSPVAYRAEGGQRICAGRVLFGLSRTF